MDFYKIIVDKLDVPVRDTNPVIIFISISAWYAVTGTISEYIPRVWWGVHNDVASIHDVYLILLNIMWRDSVNSCRLYVTAATYTHSTIEQRGYATRF
jgi:hypothetical protein